MPVCIAVWKIFMTMNTAKEMGNAKDKASQEKVSEFRMGTPEKSAPSSGKTGFKTKLIKAAGGYGGFIRQYKRDPFYCTESEAKKLVGRNQKCICGSGRKVKKCCM
ncbi:MAG: hypothetical protein CMC15_17995 [Flavobacteriaceae bacterium]|nr:hypothetical protein [Flavobacteriaceae bacterium]